MHQGHVAIIFSSFLAVCSQALSLTVAGLFPDGMDDDLEKGESAPAAPAKNGSTALAKRLSTPGRAAPAAAGAGQGREEAGQQDGSLTKTEHRAHVRFSPVLRFR